MTLPGRLSIVTLGMADLARAIAFYEALGSRSYETHDLRGRRENPFRLGGRIEKRSGRRALVATRAGDDPADGRSKRREPQG